MLVLIIFGICVVGALTYISILGENHQINRVIVNYFNNLKDGEYIEACKNFAWYSSTVQPLAAAMAQLDEDFEAGQLDERVYRQERKVLEVRIQEMLGEHCLNFNFLLELSLLKHYNLIDQYNYKIELTRSHFWIPYSSNDSVRVSVLFRRKEDKKIGDALSSDQSRNLIDNLIVVVREKGTWKIKQFALADSSIAGIYNDLRQNVDLNKYVKMTSDGLKFQNAEINFKALTPIDKRLLSFSLYKIQKSLDVPRKKTEGFPLIH